MTGAFFLGKKFGMWKIVVGFILFAALALFLLNRGGDIDMGGEKHSVLKSGASGFFDTHAMAAVYHQARIG
jgi:hypothetical protein